MKIRVRIVHSIESRAKDPDSFRKKASLPSSRDPNEPRYSLPTAQITDLAGVRIIAYFQGSVEALQQVVEREFDVFEYSDKSDELEADERFGYRSVHYLAKLRDSRAQLLEYKRFAGLVVEIQARTILQHAWAEIEHDVQYKARTALPAEVRRRFMSLAGMLEVADREFEAIQALNTNLRTHALESVARGDLGDVELTPEALHAYLDKRYGPDGPMRPWSYNWTVRLLRSVDLDTVAELDELIDDYDDDKISRLLFGSRQGQLTRLEHVVLAALGEKFIDAHPWNRPGDNWFVPKYRSYLQTLQTNGIKPRATFEASTNAVDQAS